MLINAKNEGIAAEMALAAIKAGKQKPELVVVSGTEKVALNVTPEDQRILTEIACRILSQRPPSQ